MTEDTTLALEALRRAMNLEVEGRTFYRKAAQTTEDNEGQKTFSALANDEQNHYELLKQQYDALKQAGGWTVPPEIKAVSLDLTKALFPRGLDALKKAVAVKSSNWDALLFGLDIEIKSYDLYRKAAAEITDAQAKQIFEFLAGQEMGHFNLLMMRYDSLFGPSTWWP